MNIIYSPYANRWSKTMIGYGPEDNHFVVELTYNYGISEYKSGNDFRGITISSKEAIDRAKSNGWPVEEENGKFVLQAPGGYKYYIINEPQPEDKGNVNNDDKIELFLCTNYTLYLYFPIEFFITDPVQKVTLSSSNLQTTIAYWKDILSMKVIEQEDNRVLMCYDKDQAKLEFIDIGKCFYISLEFRLKCEEI